MHPHLSPRMIGLLPDARASLGLAARQGFTGVELLVRDVAERGEDPGELAVQKADLGLLGGSWPLPVDWRSDEERFRRDLALLPRYARLASQLGLDRTGTWVLPEILDPALRDRERPYEAALHWHADRLDAIARILGDHGHRLGLEAIGAASFRSGTGPRFIDGIEALAPLVGELRRRGRDVGLTVDSFHLFAAGEPVEAALRLGADSIVAVHVSDIADGVPPDPATIRDDQRGFPAPGGAIPNARLLRILSDAGYDGPVLAEPVPGGPPRGAPLPDAEAQEELARRASEALRSVWPVGSG